MVQTFAECKDRIGDHERRRHREYIRHETTAHIRNALAPGIGEGTLFERRQFVDSNAADTGQLTESVRHNDDDWCSFFVRIPIDSK